MRFIVTFGISVPLKSHSGSKVGGLSISVKDNTENGIKQRKKRNIDENASLDEEFGRSIINIGQLLAEFHVEYEIVQGYNFRFDCCCWDTAAKIYTETGDRCLRTVPCFMDESAVWIVFSVHHSAELSQAQLRKFFDHKITCRIYSGRARFSERAKKDKVKGFYVDENCTNLGQHDFVEIFPLNSYESDFSIVPTTQRMPQPTMVGNDIDGHFTVISYLDPVPEPAHQYKFRKMLKKRSFPSQPLHSVSISDEINHKVTSTKSDKVTRKPKPSRNKSKMKDREKAAVHEVILPAEVCFSEMGVITSYDSSPQITGVSSLLIYVQCDEILSSKQLRKDLNLLSIKLEKLKNFPTDRIVENDFPCLYVKITVVDRTIITPYYKPERAICFEHTKCFLCEEFSPERLISFLSTEPLVVKLIGLRNLSSNDRNTLHSDTSISKDFSMSSKNEVLLGAAMFDLSELLKDLIVSLSNGLFHPSTVFRADIDGSQRISSNGDAPIFTNSPLNSELLTFLNTSIKVKIRLACNLHATQREILRRPDIFNRIFLALSDLRLANDILRNVTLHNCSVLNGNQPSTGIPVAQHTQMRTSAKHFVRINSCISNENSLITGFAIDCHDKFYIFLEGLSNGRLLKLWEMTMNLPAASGYVYYNSECVFLSRLYEDFVPVGGLIKIQLSEPLDEKLRDHRLYIGENRKAPDANALRIIGLMRLTWTMRSLCQTRTFLHPHTLTIVASEIYKIYTTECITNINREE